MGICNTNAVLRPVPEADKCATRDTVKKGTAHNARNIIKRGERSALLVSVNLRTNRQPTDHDSNGTATEQQRASNGRQHTGNSRQTDGKAAEYHRRTQDPERVINDG